LTASERNGESTRQKQTNYSRWSQKGKGGETKNLWEILDGEKVKSKKYTKMKSASN
jgi:hypothetical protein